MRSRYSGLPLAAIRSPSRCSASSASVPISLISTTSVAASRVDAAINSLRLSRSAAVARQMVVAAVFAAAFFNHSEVAKLRVLGHPIVNAGVLRRPGR